MDTVLDGSLVNAATLLRRGEISATELLSAALARIDASGAHGASSNPFLRVCRASALERARALDALDHQANTALPLYGIPYARKDLFAVPGETTTFCAHPQFHQRASTLADCLSRLNAAGGIDVGALHMSEFAMGPSGWSSINGAIDNPIEADGISGGSSSGSAVAVAKKLVFGALGTDTGGSNRLPAVFCGVVALKPSRGRISTQGVLPVSKTLDVVGPFARSVADCMRLWEALTGERIEDTSASHAEPPPRFGVLTPDSLPVAPDADVAHALDAVVERLADAGHRVAPVHWTEFARMAQLSGTVFLAEAAVAHAQRLERHAELIGPQVRERLRLGQQSDEHSPAYLAALHARAQHHDRFAAHVLGDIDVLVLPVSPSRAPTRASYANLDTNAILRKNSRVAAYTGAFNYLDVPVLAMPASPAAQDTIGIQLLVRRGCDAQVLRAGRIIERLLSRI